MILFDFWFFLDFLKVWQRHPWLSKFYVATMALSVVALPGMVFGYYVEIAPVLMACSLVSLPFCLAVAWRSIGLDILGSRWVASAYAWYCLVVAFNLLSVLGFVLGHTFTIYGWQYGAPIYVVFLMSGVLTRVREMERRRDQAIASSLAAEAKAEVAHAQREEKSRFLSLMTHELKTPLAAIDAAVQALGYASEREDLAATRRHQRIREAVARLNMLLEDSLAVVRDEAASNRPFHFRRNRVVMEELLRSLRAAYSTSGSDGVGTARVRFEAVPNVEFRGDGTLLRLALSNLLDNALKYGMAGHAVTVSVRERPHLDQPGIAFEVTSAFAGAIDEDCAVWFEKFWRGKEHATIEGVGLGLYLVRSIAEAHGGDAWCCARKDQSGLVPAWLVATLWIRGLVAV
ncbi:MAG: HAMP domain-containing sensor histidine kinase [Propionivibrio sp.]